MSERPRSRAALCRFLKEHPKLQCVCHPLHLLGPVTVVKVQGNGFRLSQGNPVEDSHIYWDRMPVHFTFDDRGFDLVVDNRHAMRYEYVLEEESEEDRVARELSEDGESNYKGVKITPTSQEGYTLTGFDWYGSIEDAMKAIEEEEATS